MFQQLLRGNVGESPFGRMQTEGMQNILGFDPGGVGVEAAIRAGLSDPRDATAGLFSEMRSFEDRMLMENAAGAREGAGMHGSRFSRGGSDIEARIRSELAGEFGRNRESALLDAQGQRNQLIAALLQGSTSAAGVANDPMRIMAQFAAPGAPVHQEGWGGDALGAILRAAAAYKTFGASEAARAAT
jgi:hypothetical protein